MASNPYDYCLLSIILEAIGTRWNPLHTYLPSNFPLVGPDQVKESTLGILGTGG